MKNKLADVSLDQHSLKAAWEGVIRAINAKESQHSLPQCYKCCKKCIEIDGICIKKRCKINTLLTIIIELIT